MKIEHDGWAWRCKCGDCENRRIFTLRAPGDPVYGVIKNTQTLKWLRMLRYQERK